jgi:hypothetical protein
MKLRHLELHESNYGPKSDCQRRFFEKNFLSIGDSSIVPDGTDHSLDPFPSTKVLGCFHCIPTGSIHSRLVFLAIKP